MISNLILKISKDIISNSLSDISDELLSHQIFPHDFKVARVTPIRKGGERDDVGNYRPISVLPTVARVFEKIIYTQLYNYLMQNQGNHIFEKLNSLSFPGYFKLFPEQLKREKFDGVHFCWRSCHIFFVFLEFPGFFYKSSNFPEILTIFKFPEFSRFVATLKTIFWVTNSGDLDHCIPLP